MRFPCLGDVSNDDQLIEPEVARNAVDYRGDAVALPSKAEIGLDQAAIAVCKAADTTVEALRGRSRSTELAAARKAFAVVAVQCIGHAVADVAVFLHKHPGSVSRWLETPTATDDKPGLVKHILELAAADFDVFSTRM
jgi:hypothetical protein